MLEEEEEEGLVEEEAATVGIWKPATGKVMWLELHELTKHSPVLLSHIRVVPLQRQGRHVALSLRKWLLLQNWRFEVVIMHAVYDRK